MFHFRHYRSWMVLRSLTSSCAIDFLPRKKKQDLTIIPEAKIGYSPWKHGSWLKFLSSPTCSGTSTVTDDLERKVAKTWEFWRCFFPSSPGDVEICLGYLEYGPLAIITVTTRMTTFLGSGIPCKSSCPTATGRGPHLRVTLDIPRLTIFGNNSPSLTKNDDFIILVLTPLNSDTPLSIKVKTKILRLKSHHKNPSRFTLHS